MSNMSYCRFQNTLGDLNDCVTALGHMTEAVYSSCQIEEEEDEYGNEIVLGRAEERARREMVDAARAFLELNDSYEEALVEYSKRDQS